MKVKLLFVGLVLFVTMVAVVAAEPARAADDATTTTQVVKGGDVTWTMSPDVCADISVEMTGTGRRFQVITTVLKNDGSQKIYNNDFVTGTATDTDGGTYDWIYANQDRHNVPAGGSPIQVNMKDSFILSGTGANTLNVAFAWKWTYSPPASEWPPVDNWNQQITIGDPLHCDPL